MYKRRLLSGILAAACMAITYVAYAVIEVINTVAALAEPIKMELERIAVVRQKIGYGESVVPDEPDKSNDVARKYAALKADLNSRCMALA